MSIVLVGFMGAGKTTVGKIVAERMGLKFFDTDEVIENILDMSIPEIFKTFGEGFFRKMENEVIDIFRKRKNFVLSTGGGLPVYLKNSMLLKSIGKVFYLKAHGDTLFRRVKDSTFRPLMGSFFKLLKEREPIYKKISDFEIDTTYIDEEETSFRVITFYENCCR